MSHFGGKAELSAVSDTREILNGVALLPSFLWSLHVPLPRLRGSGGLDRRPGWLREVGVVAGSSLSYAGQGACH